MLLYNDAMLLYMWRRRTILVCASVLGVLDLGGLSDVIGRHNAASFSRDCFNSGRNSAPVVADVWAGEATAGAARKGWRRPPGP